MAAVVNYRDLLLEATDPRILPVTLPPNVTVPVDSVPGLGDLAGQDTVDVSNFASGIAPIGIVAALPSLTGYTGPKVVLLTTDGRLYRISGTAWAAVVNTGDLVGTITSTQMGPGSVTTPALSANVVTANNMAANSVVFGTIAAGAVSAAQVVAGSLTADRLDTRNLTIRDASGNVIFGAGVKLATANINGLGALATQSTVNLGSQVTGQLASSGVSGLGALALLNTVNLSTQVVGALNGQTQVTNLGTLAYASAIAATQIGAGTLAAGVVYAGTVNASQVNAGTLNGVLLQVGSGRSPSGRSFEIQANGAIYADDLFAGFALFSNTDAPGNVPVTTSSYGDVVAFWATAEESTSNCHAIRGKNVAIGASGLVGTASNYAFYAEAGTHGPFTGSHDALVPNGTSVEPGDIVADVQCLSRAGWSNTLFEVATSVRTRQTGVLGVVSFVSGPLSGQVPAALLDDAGEPTSDYAHLKDDYAVIVVNALGEGQMNVCGEGGDIAAGDLIVTSSMPGKGMRQADDIVRSYTVARAREAVMFASPTEIKAIACTYHCG